jgi:hypothetical protein
MDVGELGHQFLFYNSEDHSAEHRAPYRSDAPDHGHEQDGNAGLKSEYASRVNEQGVAGKNTPGDAGERRLYGMYTFL